MRAVLRAHPVGARQPDWSQLDAPVLGHFAENDGFFAPDDGRGPRGPARRRSARTPSSSSTPVSTTPSSTTPGPRSTTPRPRPAAWVQTRRLPARATSTDRSARLRQPVERYLELGLRLGRHVDGFVDAYYGPADVADRVAAEPLHRAGRAGRRRRPADRRPRRRRRRARARRRRAAAGCGPRSSGCTRRPASWPARTSPTPTRSSSATACGPSDARRGASSSRRTAASTRCCPGRVRWPSATSPGARPRPSRPSKLPAVIDSLADDFRERTDRLFGLPDGEHIDWELVTDKPWSGFNYYLGDLRSRVAINLDLPVLSTSIAHLVAHEAYPGHHTEHTRKEVGPGARPRPPRGDDLPGRHAAVPAGRGPGRPRPRGRRWDAGPRRPWPSTCARSACATTPRWSPRWRWPARRSTTCGATSAFLLHEDGADEADAIAYADALGPGEPATGPRRWSSSSPTRRGGPTSPATSRACPLCRSFVDGDPTRFQRLLDEQLPAIARADLVS